MFSSSDGAIQTASPGDATIANLDSAHLGDHFAEVLLLDQGAYAAKARAELGWQPSHPVLVEEFRHGSYRTNGS
jgi:hypothetical protein